MVIGRCLRYAIGKADFFVILLVTGIMILSTLIVSLTIRKQNQTAANELLQSSFNLIRDELESLQTNLITHSRQLAVIDNMGNDVKMVYKYKSEPTELFVGNIYRKMTQSVYKISLDNHLDFARLYDLDGELVAFVELEPDRATLGYPFRKVSGTSFQACSLESDEKISYDAWKTVDQLPFGLPLKATTIADKEIVRLEKLGDRICLVFYAPVTAGFFSDATQAIEQKPIGFVTAVRQIDEGVVKHLARLTGQDINVFHPNGLIAGTIDTYDRFDISTVDATGAAQDVKN